MEICMKLGLWVKGSDFQYTTTWQRKSMHLWHLNRPKETVGENEDENNRPAEVEMRWPGQAVIIHKIWNLFPGEIVT